MLDLKKIHQQKHLKWVFKQIFNNCFLCAKRRTIFAQVLNGSARFVVIMRLVGVEDLWGRQECLRPAAGDGFGTLSGRSHPGSHQLFSAGHGAHPWHLKRSNGTGSLSDYKNKIKNTVLKYRYRRQCCWSASSYACHYVADPDPTCHFDADPDPAYQFDAKTTFQFGAETTFQFGADPHPQHWP